VARSVRHGSFGTTVRRYTATQTRFQVKKAPDPFSPSSRSYPERPIVGVGAVVLDEERVVLVKRAHEPLKGHWSLPGGAVEIGETLKDAIAREVQEETGLIVDVGPIVDVLDRLRHDAEGRVEYHYILIEFLCYPRGGTLACASDAEDVSWARFDDLGRFGLTASTLDVIHSAVRRMQGAT
jgi:8-oxo-dGTP diphosphatase